MIGELAREAGVLVAVFTILDARSMSWPQIVALETVGVIAMIGGVIIERRRTD